MYSTAVPYLNLRTGCPKVRFRVLSGFFEQPPNMESGGDNLLIRSDDMHHIPLHLCTRHARDRHQRLQGRQGDAREHRRSHGQRYAPGFRHPCDDRPRRSCGLRERGVFSGRWPEYRRDPSGHSSFRSLPHRGGGRVRDGASRGRQEEAGLQGRRQGWIGGDRLRDPRAFRGGRREVHVQGFFQAPIGTA